MSKKNIISKSDKTALKLKVLAKEKESVRRKLVVTAKEKERVRNKLLITAKKLAVTAKEKESVRRKLEVTAREKERVRNKLVITAKQLAVTAKEKESVRRKLVLTAKEKERVRNKLVVTAKQLAVTAKEKERVRNKLVLTAKEKERVRSKLVVTAKEKESVRRKLAVIVAEKEAILGSITDGIIAVDKTGKIILMNLSAEKMLGYTREESIGKKWYDILKSEDKKNHSISPKKSAIQAVLTASKSIPITPFYYLRKDKTKFPVSRTVSPIVLQKKLIGAINIFRDITREYEIDRSKSEFVAIASHQLRKPLTGIRWTAERLLKDKNISIKESEYLTDIHKSALKLSELVDSLLDISRIESGTIRVISTRFDIVNFLNDYFKESEPLFQKKNLIFKFNNNLPALEVMTDKNALLSIIHSTTSNAIEYSPEKGKVNISLQKKEKTFLITIRDNGIGIPLEEQKRIFQKYFRASNAAIMKAGGTGIGLFVASQMTNLLKGKIWLESNVNKGTTLYIELPLVSSSREVVR